MDTVHLYNYMLENFISKICDKLLQNGRHAGTFPVIEFLASFQTLPKGPALDKQKIRVDASGQNLNEGGIQTACVFEVTPLREELWFPQTSKEYQG